MSKEYGGYLPLELRDGGELFDRYPAAKVARVNCGRNAIALAALSAKPKKLYIPYYNCNVVADTLRRLQVPIEFYSLNERLEPDLDRLEADEWIVYANYFGVIPQNRIEAIAGKYERVIFDNTQAFFAAPVLDGRCLNAYSPRKFVGVSDGAYLVWSGNLEVNEDYPQDVSWDRAAFLFKSIELGTNAAYSDNLQSKSTFDDGIKIMSVLTQKMLRSMDYDEIRARRSRNFSVLSEELQHVNGFWLPLYSDAPFVYPLYVSEEIRGELVRNKIYVSQWWKYLLELVEPDSVEARLSRHLLPLPIDQRYTERDMREIAGIVKGLLQGHAS